jgi:cellulose biosynthesis protein BcsQ
MQKCGGRIGNIMDFGKSIFEYIPDSHGAEDYLALCKEIVERG